MLRLALIGYALAIASSAFAQPTTAPTPASPPPSACHPVTSPKHTYRPLGQHTAMVCTNAHGTVAYPMGFSCRHDRCNLGSFGEAMFRVTTAPDYVKALDNEWAQAIRWTCDAPPDAPSTDLCTERAKWVSDNWLDWTANFKPAVWRVKVSGTATTRPAFKLTNGVVGKAQVARAPVGAVCNLSKPTAPSTNGDIRAEFGPDNVAGVVTLCAKVK